MEVVGGLAEERPRVRGQGHLRGGQGYRVVAVKVAGLVGEAIHADRVKDLGLEKKTST